MNLYNLNVVYHLPTSSIIPVIFTRELQPLKPNNCMSNIFIGIYSFKDHGWPHAIRDYESILLNYPLVIQHDNRRRPIATREMEVSWNSGTRTPKSLILIGFSLLNHPAIGVSKFMETPNWEINSWNFCLSFSSQSDFPGGSWTPGEEELPGFSPEECPEADGGAPPLGHPCEEVGSNM